MGKTKGFIEPKGSRRRVRVKTKGFIKPLALGGGKGFEFARPGGSMGLALLWSKIKRLKLASSFTSPDFFLKKNSVMKWLWSKKFINGPVTTTPTRHDDSRYDASGDSIASDCSLFHSKSKRGSTLQRVEKELKGRVQE